MNWMLDMKFCVLEERDFYSFLLERISIYCTRQGQIITKANYFSFRIEL